MSEHRPQKPSDTDADLEREIRRECKFSLAEAIGRLAGPGMMKGESPMTLRRQAEAVIEEYLNQHLADADGALAVALGRQAKASEFLLTNLEQPLVVLAETVQRILGCEYRLQELVREADVEWGRVFGERPYFEQEGRPHHPDDPYTVESVRAALKGLLEALAAGGAGGNA